MDRNNKVFILVTGIRAEHGDYDELLEMMENEIAWRIGLAERYKFVLLAPHIPRSHDIYAAAFDNKVLL